MRFTDATPTLSETAWSVFGETVRNATVIGGRILNETCESFDELTGARVVDALTIALEPGKPVSVLVGVITFLLLSKQLAVRRAAHLALEAHAHFD